MDFEDTLPAGDVEAAVVRTDRRVKEAVPEVRRVFIEAEAPSDPVALSHTTAREH